MQKITKLLFLFGLMTLFCPAGQNAYAGYLPQEKERESLKLQQDESKSIRAREFLKKRPEAPKTENKNYTPVAVIPQPKAERYYRFVKARKVKKAGRKPPVKTMENASLGFTLFRLKDAGSSEADESKGFEINQKGKKQKVERIEAETALAVGDEARIVIESLSHDGYLYVVNREKFADGTYGVAKVIYPMPDARKNSNFVKAGVLTFIPPYPDEPFEITSRTGKKQVAEELTVIVSPKPMIFPAMLDENRAISTDRLTEWIKLYEVDEVQRELEGGVGQIISIEEQNAGRDQSKGFEAKPRLTQTDEPPQTVFDMKIKRGNPILTRILLEIKPD